MVSFAREEHCTHKPEKLVRRKPDDADHDDRRIHIVEVKVPAIVVDEPRNA